MNAAAMLGQAIYWNDITTDPDGWFWKTREDWEQELYLTREEQENARNHLRALGDIWQERRSGLPAKLYFRVDLDALAEKGKHRCRRSTTVWNNHL